MKGLQVAIYTKINLKVVISILWGGCCLSSVVVANTFDSSIKPTGLNKSDLSQPNVVFIAIDDLKAGSGAITPNIDAIAKGGVRFTQAYAQQAICGPSRASVLTGTRPDTTGVIHNYIKFRDKYPDIITLPQHFSAHGYNTSYVGKIFHHGDKDDKLSWNWPAVQTIPNQIAKPRRYALSINQQQQIANKKIMKLRYGEQAKFGLGSGPAFEKAKVADTAYKDGYNAQLAILTIQELTEQSHKPFFFGFGLNKPHLPWVAPQKYWDLYQNHDIELTTLRAPPKNGASVGLHSSFELRTFSNIPKKGPINDTLAIELKHAYLASVSYVDAQIGKLIRALESQNIMQNTIIVLWSDHGYHIGEMGIWGKASNYETATRVPLIISTPETRKNPKSVTSQALVELVDLYPTLTELAGFSAPVITQGKSMVPLLENPNQIWKQAAFSQFPTPALREWGAYPLRKGMRETYFGPLLQQVETQIQHQFKHNQHATKINEWNRELFEKFLMGYAMRTSQYRIIVWKDHRDPQLSPLFVEVFDHHQDPHETVNIAELKPDLTTALLAQLKETWPNSSVSSIEQNKGRINSVDTINKDH
ncbi:sulfatase [Shewanella sp. 10N.286.52.C2]|uniref:sulfatase n=1 Tax=Shewanella sp. 10N.286.52.C2 TaxID=1880838 RepID=UPI000C8652C6|nr:sulfatase [Shewanella sp. 10N.286.52.C2]